MKLNSIEKKSAELLIEKRLAEYKDGEYYLTKLGLKVYKHMEGCEGNETK